MYTHTCTHKYICMHKQIHIYQFIPIYLDLLLYSHRLVAAIITLGLSLHRQTHSRCITRTHKHTPYIYICIYMLNTGASI